MNSTAASKISVKPRRQVTIASTPAPAVLTVLGDGDLSDWGAALLPPAVQPVVQQPVVQQVAPVAATAAEPSAPPSAGFKPTEDPRRAAALKAKQRHLMESFCDMIYYRILDTIDTVPNLEFAPIGIFHLPTPENRARDIHSCYWADKGDIRTEGTPIVQLLQGVRDHKTGKVHPEWLWGGQTAVANMNEFFGKQGWLIDCHFNGYTKEIVVNLVKEACVGKYRAYIARESKRR
jgi:hypothetical protein